MFAKLKGRISETLLLSPSCYDDNKLNKKDNKILKDVLGHLIKWIRSGVNSGVNYIN